MEARIRSGAVIDPLIRPELDGSLQDYYAQKWAEAGRGVKVLRLSGAPNAAVTISSPYVVPGSPREGYLWSVRLVSVVFSVSRFLSVTVGDTQGAAQGLNPLVFGSTASGTLNSIGFGKSQAILGSGKNLLLFAVNSTNVLSYLIWLVEAPAEMAWKI